MFHIFVLGSKITYHNISQPYSDHNFSNDFVQIHPNRIRLASRLQEACAAREAMRCAEVQAQLFAQASWLQTKRNEKTGKICQILHQLIFNYVLKYIFINCRMISRCDSNRAFRAPGRNVWVSEGGVVGWKLSFLTILVCKLSKQEIQQSTSNQNKQNKQNRFWTNNTNIQRHAASHLREQKVAQLRAELAMSRASEVKRPEGKCWILCILRYW